MPTLHLIIVCVTVLALAVLVLRAVQARQAKPTDQGAVLAGQIAVAIAGKQNDILRALLEQLEAIAMNMEPEAHVTPAPSLIGETVAVRTRPPDQTTVRGIVAAEHADRIVLREAVVYDAGGEGHAAAGLVEIHRLNISTTQVIPPPAEAA